MKKVLIIDTSILCVWLKVPGKETCGTKGQPITFEMVNAKIEAEKKSGTTFVLPIASIIETGNHIAHVKKGDKKVLGDSFAQILIDAADEKSPWAAFSAQSNLWKPEKLKSLAEKWRETVISGQSIGDASIVDVAEYYFQSGFATEIFTGDEGLKSYEPQGERIFVPRRRKN